MFSHSDISSTMIHDAAWIWGHSQLSEADIYRRFRKTFTAAPVEQAVTLEIAADSDFVAWINGEEIARGQFSDFAERKTFGKFRQKVLLREGENTLAVLVFYRGEDFFEYQKGTAGLIASLSTDDHIIRTDATWKTSLHTSFRNGHRERVTPQFGFTFHYDARHEEDWISPDFDDTNWDAARIVQEKAVGEIWQQLTPRPLPSLRVEKLRAGYVTMQGSILRAENIESAAEAITASALRVLPASAVFENFADSKVLLTASAENPLIISELDQPADGRFFIVDLGAETVGLLEFCVEAPTGTVLEIAYGEHIDDGRVRAHLGGRHFADRYVCREGIQTFQMPFRRLGARYLEIHILGAGKVLFHALGLRPTEYPTQRNGRFHSSDNLANRLHDVAVRTLELCRHEHYEDCPWREQALYGYDGRLQALYGYYAFGDYDFPVVSFGLLGESYHPENGLISLTAPARNKLKIPIFSFAWIAAVAENWLYSGKSTLFDNYRPAVDGIINRALERFDENRGLYDLPVGEGIWNFYEWTDDLHGWSENPPQGTHHAAYNLHFLEALQCYAQMLEWKGKSTFAQKIREYSDHLRAAIHRTFWDENAGFYRSQITHDGALSGKHELIQALALYGNVVPDSNREVLLQTLDKSTLAPCTLSASYYLLRAIMEQPHKHRDIICRRLTETWGDMIFAGATSLWETAAGSRDFGFAGSLCHGWSSLPVYFHQAAALGIIPTSPGFETFQLRIDPFYFEKASGVIPTPSGNITVKWHKTEDGLTIDVTAPDDLTPQTQIAGGVHVRELSYNGSVVQ